MQRMVIASCRIGLKSPLRSTGAADGNAAPAVMAGAAIVDR
ncbi:MAG: hypothetical protein QM736_02850 [Vicinamibacterales bacterium]